MKNILEVLNKFELAEKQNYEVEHRTMKII